ncbi:MAG: hypothetical protein H0V17_24940, partial [Deltaproteobacteria bacterium]|nr:hypothetical protein [Deltaproteobacteria bacterium]
HEFGPLTNPYGGCDYQGVEASWADQYKAGLECQWVDVTTIDTSNKEVTHPLSFTSNPDGLLCEGTPILDDQGYPVFEPTEFLTAGGDVVHKAGCEQLDNWDANNGGTYDVTLPQSGGSFVTRPCDRGQIGPLRNCGFEDKQVRFDCLPGSTVTLRCDLQGNNAQPQVARICEFSSLLGVGTACTFQDAMTSAAVSKGGTEVKFTCPLARDTSEPGGKVSLYSAPVFPDDSAAAMTCTVQ